MTNIILHQIQGISVGIAQKDGYLNATKLCVAYNLQKGATKKPDNWLRTQRAKDYISYLACVSQKRETDLVVIKQGGSPDEQGTWIHPKLATPFATWLSVEFEYQVQEWVREWHENKTLTHYPENVTGAIAKNPTEELILKASTAIDLLFPHVPAELRLGMKIVGVCNVDESLRPILEPHKPKLLLEAKLLSPTEIGKLMESRTGMAHSARTVNKLLCEKGFQQLTGNKNPSYEPIGQGIEFGKIIADTARGHGKTIQHLRWYESIVDLLIP